MGRLRAQIGWIVRGRASVTATLDRLTADLQALQARVDALDARDTRDDDVRTAVRTLEGDVQQLRQRQLDEFDRVRDALATTTDDLSSRISALHARGGGT